MRQVVPRRPAYRALLIAVMLLLAGVFALRLPFLYASRLTLAPYRSLVAENATEKDAIEQLGNPWRIINSDETLDDTERINSYAETRIAVEGKVLVYPEMVWDSYAVVYVFIDNVGRVFDARLRIL